VSTLKVELKGPANFVSAADRESEDLLRSMLLSTQCSPLLMPLRS
jgi:fructose-1,6-bisphosphatase/inositol monophosphatase family enzyme